MDSTLRKLLALLTEAPPEIRCAAAAVLGALEAGDAPILEALRGRLKDENPLVRRFAAEALGRMGARRALPDLVGLVVHGGEVGRAAAGAAAAMGVAGVRALQEAMGKVAPGVRPIIAAAIAQGGGTAAEEAALDSLLDPDPAVVEASRRSIESEIESDDAEEKKEFAARLLRFLRRKEAAAHPAATAAALRLLEPLAEPRHAATLWEFAGGSRPAAVRAAAMRVLSGLPPPTERKAIALLFDSLSADRVALAEPALRLLQRTEIPRGLERRLLGLLESPEPGARAFALEKLRTHDTPEVGRAVLDHLDHPDPEVRRAAEETLVALQSGRQALLERLDRTRDSEVAGRVAGVLLRTSAPFDEGTAKTIASRALRWVATEDPRAEVGVALLRRAKGGEAFDLLLAKGRAARRAGRWPEALAFYRRVAKDRRFAAPDRFDLAVVGLHLGGSDASADRRTRDPALLHLEDLLRAEGFDLIGALRREKSLGPRELQYVGFHFAEKAGPPGKFGGEVLRTVLERSPRSAEGRAAKNKLIREGLS